MIKRLDHVEIVPSDLARTLNFYTAILGFKIQWRHKVDRPPLEEALHMELGGTLIELFGVKSPAPLTTEQWQVGYRGIALEVENMDKTIEYLKSQGVVIAREPETVRRGERGNIIRTAAIRDPDGLSIQLVQRG